MPPLTGETQPSAAIFAVTRSRRNRMEPTGGGAAFCQQPLLRWTLFCVILLLSSLSAAGQGSVGTQGSSKQRVLGDPLDVSEEFSNSDDTYFVGNRVTAFDAASAAGTLEWKRFARRPNFSFNKIDRTLTPDRGNEFPPEYDENPALPFSIEFISPRTIRLRINTSPDPLGDEPSLMLIGSPPKDTTWKVEQTDKAITYKSAFGSVTVIKDPWEIQIHDSSGKLLTTTQNINVTRGSFSAPLPFSFVRRASDFGRQITG